MPNTYVRRPEDRAPKDREWGWRVPVARWSDPYPSIQGSSIEKMVMAELVRRGIYFEHTPQTNSLGGLVDKTWEPDFLLPQYHIWIEIQGAYFHTLPGAPERDALRFAYIASTGWRPIFWWEDDIRNRLHDIMDAVPELYRPNLALNKKAAKTWKTTPGLPFMEGALGTRPEGSVQSIDHLKGLRAALSARARPPQHLVVRRRTKRRPK